MQEDPSQSHAQPEDEAGGRMLEEVCYIVVCRIPLGG